MQPLKVKEPRNFWTLDGLSFVSREQLEHHLAALLAEHAYVLYGPAISPSGQCFDFTIHVELKPDQ